MKVFHPTVEEFRHPMRYFRRWVQRVPGGVAFVTTTLVAAASKLKLAITVLSKLCLPKDGTRP